jgi:hypothetical protein
LSRSLYIAALILLSVALSLELFASAQGGQLPPISYVCPMPAHSEVVEDKPGKCPLCAMVLVPVRIDMAWSCPNHAAVVKDTVGLCPIDRRELVQVVVQRHWVCDADPQSRLTDPGVCPDGSRRRLVQELRAHGDHNPRHGGQFFMASDKWHHVEATHPRPGILQVYVYDNFTKPMSVKSVTGRAVTQETFDPQTKQTREHETAPLRPSRDGKILEARVDVRTLPAKITVKMKFNERLAEERFDFAFDAYSHEPALITAAPNTLTAAQTASATRSEPTGTSTSASASPANSSPATTRPAREQSSSATPKETTEPSALPSPAQALPFGNPGMYVATPAQIDEPLPTTVAALLDRLRERHAETKSLVESGQLSAVYVPALRTKAVALALEDHIRALPEAAQAQVRQATRQVVVTAWQLDAAGDVGNAVLTAAAYGALANAVRTLEQIYGSLAH